MNPFRWTVLRLRALFGRPTLERDMQLEMRDHLDRATELLLARGLPQDAARAQARREFGNLTALQEDARDARGARWVDTLLSDIHFAFRQFRRRPLTTATIVAVLALGIGANSAIFSGLQAETSRPAPAVPKDDAHVRIHGTERASRGARWQVRGLSFTELTELATRTQTFSAVAGWLAHDVVLDAADSSGARGVGAEFVTPNFFATLGVPLVSGTGFASAAPLEATMVAVMSYRMAERLYGGPAGALGRRILVNEVPVRVVGVAPDRFQGAIPNSARPALWIPIGSRAEIARTSPRWLNDGSDLSVFARLAPAATRDQATVMARSVVARGIPDSTARAGGERSAEVLGMREPLPSSLDPEANSVLLIFGFLWVVALLILLVACTNVGSLLVASAVGRRHEIAVRLSLGASRARLVRQLLTESSILALAGGAGGLLVFWWVTTIFARSLNVDLTADVGTVAFTMVFALGTGLLFGLSPALHATRGAVAGALRDSGAGSTRRSRLQRTFVVAQIALSQPLLVLLAVTLSTIAADLSVIASATSERMVAARFRPLTRTGSPGQRREAVDSLMPRLARHPGVVGVVHDAAAFTTRRVSIPGALPGNPGGDPIGVHVEGTEPGYFALLGVPLLLGRGPELSDTAGADYRVVIGSDLARTLWGAENPIGRRLASSPWAAGGPDSLYMEVVGVYDAAYTTSRGAGTRVYTAHGRRWRRDVLLIRTQGPGLAALPDLRRVIRAEAPALPMTTIETLAQVNDDERRIARQVSILTGSGVGLALLLASLGLYGVVSLAVRQRHREIGIRIAVGGRPARVARMFFESGVRLSAVGIVFGLPLSLVAVRLMVSGGQLILPEMNLWPIGLQISALVLAVASAASWMPARRASRVDPASTLRTE